MKSSSYSGITPKRVTSSGVHLRGLAPGNTAAKKRRSGGELFTVSDLTRPGIKSKTYRADSSVFNH